jgi:hypothetical protein
MPVLAFLALMVFFATFRISFLSSVAERIKSDIPEGQVLSVMPPLSYIEQIREVLVRKDNFSRLSSKALAVHVLEVWQRICRRPLRLSSTIACLLAYLLVLAVGVVSFSAIEVISLQHSQAARHEVALDFQRFTSPEGNFSILMPGVPKELPRDSRTPRGMPQIHAFQDSHKVRPFFWKNFGVAYVDVPEGLTQSRTLEERLDDGVKGLFLYRRGKIIEQKHITSFGNPGREVRYKADAPFSAGIQCVSRMISAGGRLYILTYGESRKFSFSEDLDLDMAHKFFDSFEPVVSRTESQRHQ